MATDPQTIIDAIDAAMATWAGKPVSVTINGHTTTYRTFDDLTRARDYYQRLLNSTTQTKLFTLRRFAVR